MPPIHPTRRDVLLCLALALALLLQLAPLVAAGPPKAPGVPGFLHLLDDAEARSIDGTGNNLAHPTWGATGTQLLRMAPAAYPGDGSGASMMGPPDRPWPRVISNALSDQAGQDVPSPQGLTNMAWQWGQFLDHDITLTPTDPTDAMML
ncbi:MAG: peroxidase family protein, partial [Candidatus Thermoplasmatota archaeon]|nr:peroxidase family protein [Candidatus Thermoplasmatota archaeon]